MTNSLHVYDWHCSIAVRPSVLVLWWLCHNDHLMRHQASVWNTLIWVDNKAWYWGYNISAAYLFLDGLDMSNKLHHASGRHGRTALLGGMCSSATFPTLARLIRMLRKEEWELADYCLPQSLGSLQQYNQSSGSWLERQYHSQHPYNRDDFILYTRMFSNSLYADIPIYISVWQDIYAAFFNFLTFH